MNIHPDPSPGNADADQKYPLVIAYHLVLNLYGTWLPNDPRGSTSHVVRMPHVASLGEVHYGRRIVQPPHLVISDFYRAAAPALQHAVVTFSPDEQRKVCELIGRTIIANNYTCYALAVMPEHVHLCIRKHRDSYEQMYDHFKAPVADDLRAGRFGPEHPVWADGGYAVFLDEPADIRRTIQYIRTHAASAPDPPFIAPYDNWPFHEGHSMNSPYIRRLKSLGRWPPRY